MSGWQTRVRQVTPYVPGEQPSDTNVIKLNTNESPYPPAPGVAEALQGQDAGLLRLYPDPEASQLTSAIAKRYGLSPDRVFVGVGSDDVLSISFLTFFAGPEPLLFPDVTYSFYSVWADVYRIPYEKVPLDEDFRIRPEDYIGRPASGIIFANPNAPTGIALALADVERITAANRDKVVIVDEAYVDFGGESAVSLLDRYDNLLVVQTFSKSRSGAGLRIGYAMGSAEMIRCMNDIKFSINSYTMNRPAILAGCAVMDNETYYAGCVRRIVETRERAKKELAALGFVFPDAKTNFILARHEKMPAKEIFTRLREKKIFVRYFGSKRIEEYLRITIGTDAEMDALFAALREILSGAPDGEKHD